MKEMLKSLFSSSPETEKEPVIKFRYMDPPTGFAKNVAKIADKPKRKVAKKKAMKKKSKK